MRFWHFTLAVLLLLPILFTQSAVSDEQNFLKNFMSGSESPAFMQKIAYKINPSGLLGEDELKSAIAKSTLIVTGSNMDGPEKALPIFTVLTISATASEMDGNAVVSDDAAKQKRSISSSILYPKVSVIDPSVQSSLPKAQTAFGAIDGLTHVMEFYFVGAKEETTLAIGEALMRAIISSCDKLMKNPKDEDARANMAWAITLALNGTSGAGLRGGDWSTHGIEYAISGIYPGVAHAAGLSVAYPAWILHVKDKNPETFLRWAKEVWGKNSVEEGVKTMKSKFKEWGAPITLAELGIKKSGIPEMADEFMRLGRKGALKTLDRNDAIRIFESVAE